MKVVGHRGAASYAPENTFASFDLAVKMGVDAIETDVQMTKDGYLVIFHDDDSVSRTTNGTGRISDMLWSEVQQLDAGSWFNPHYTGEKVPLLDSFLDKYARKTPIDLEIKQEGIEDLVVDTVERLNVFENITFTSFFFAPVQNIQKIRPKAKVGFLADDATSESIQMAKEARLTQFSPPAKDVTKELVQELRALEFYVRAWGIDSAHLMNQVVIAGADGMTVNFPDLLLEELGRGEKARKIVDELKEKNLLKR